MQNQPSSTARIVHISDLPDAHVSHDNDVIKKVIHKHGDIPHMTQYARATLKPGQKATKHSHKDMTEIFTVFKGKAEFELDGQISIVIEGGVVTIPPGVSHEIRNQSQDDLQLLYFGIQH
jgi:quercetin dioxygenase-like cupin family protein